MSFSDHFAVSFTRSTNALNPHFTASPPSMGVKWDEMTMMISSIERGELTAGETVADHLKLPARGEAGMKSIRRSFATILRDRLPMDAWGEIEMLLGHDRFDDVSDLYAPFRPDYLRRALAAIGGIIDEIEAKAPGAYRAVTATGGKVIRLGVQNNG